MEYTFDATNPDYTVSNNGLTIVKTTGNGNWSNERILPLMPQGSGIYSCKIVIDAGSLNYTVGIKRSDVGIVNGIGNTNSYAYHQGGMKGTNWSWSNNYGPALAPGDVVDIVYDSSLGILSFVRNDIDLGVAFTGLVGDYYFGYSCLSVGAGVTISSYVLSVFLESSQVIATNLTLQSNQLLSMAPRLYSQFTQVLAAGRKLNLIQSQVFDTTTPLYLSQEQVFNNLAQVALFTTQIMRNYGAPVALEILQTWAAYDYNLVYLPMVQLIGAQMGAVLQEIQFSVTVAASRVGVIDCNFNRKGFCNVASLLLRKRQEWINKAVGDPVVLTVLGEQYQMIVVNKLQDAQITQGTYEAGYLLECASVTCQLAEGINPDIAASRVTASFPAGTMLTEILDFLTDGVCSYSLAVPDFPVGEYAFDNSERYAALREVLPEQYGWIIKTDQPGVLQLSQWRKPETGGAGQKTLTMSRKSLTPPADTIYTQVEIRNYNQQDGTSGLTLEVVDNGDGTGTIYGYSVPWTDGFSVFDSEDSPAPSLLVTGGVVEEVEIEDTNVEFVDYAANLSKPCYSDPVIDWGYNDSLYPVSYGESGALTTATEPGYSVAVEITYTTQRKKWLYDNRKVDVSQVRLKYDGV